MKNFLSIFAFSLLVVSCSSTRTTTAVRHKPKSSPQQPRFLENIAVNGSPTPNDAETEVDMPTKIKARKDVPGSVYSTDIENCHNLQFKYAILMEEEVETVTNSKLIGFLEEWYGIPYKYGGVTRTGIDCSAFTCIMLDTVYGISLPRTAREQYRFGHRISKSDLMQGDLVFFNTTGGVSHVGVYLSNNKFVHASASSGVMISDLDDVYFSRRYLGAARPR